MRNYKQAGEKSGQTHTNWAAEMAQWVETLFAKYTDLVAARTRMMEGESRLP